MVGKPKVTVIIPCHADNRHTLNRAVGSALDADAVIVFCDGADSSSAVRFMGADMWLSDTITYELSPSRLPLGVCGARNMTIERAGDGLIIPLDADDYFLPDGVNHLREAWRPNSFVYGGWRNDDMEIFPARQPKRIRDNNLCQATMLFHRDDWLKVGGYDSDFNIGFEDYAFQCALVDAGVEPVRIDYPIHHYSSGGKRSAKALKYKKFLIQMLADKYPSIFTAKVKA